MCGIAGAWARDAAAAPAAWTADVERMLGALRHRGPDGEGVAEGAGTVLGAVRLAVLDPERGQQPMWTADGRHCVVLNGEIVNHVELRAELEARGARFRTACDTEVLLELLARDGEAALSRLDGMFALAYLDAETGDVLLARDPCGIKPLYWTRDGDRVLFASEPAAFRALPGFRSRLDDASLLDYLAFQLPLTDRTFLEDVRRVPPGTVLRLRRGAEPERAALPPWDAPADVPRDADDAAETLRELIRTSVRRHLRSDVPLGAHLSGGVDSSLLAALAARETGKPLHVFTGAFDERGFDERIHARSVADEIGAVRHEILLGPADLAEALPAAVRAMGEPLAGPGLLPQWCVAREAARHVKVVLGGQGGDELFGGYVRHVVLAIAQAVRERGADVDAEVARHRGVLRGYEPLLERFGAGGWREPAVDGYFRLLHRADGLADVLSGDLREALRRHPSKDRFRACFENAAATAHGPRTDGGDAARFDRAVVLPALLHVEDRTSMAWSLESRVPLLGRPLLSFVERASDALLLGDGRPKALLRRAAAPDLPEAARRRPDKMGFPVPLAGWARGPLEGFVRDLLLDGTGRERGLVEPRAVERVLAGESVEARHLWALLNLELWTRDHPA